ncbi:MAG TPA: CD225/dispanin family protein [Pyrinomonadaceae bacterium]|nr:CD225/dispanin family protein [Pyrinomonadaceae bacterium]
MQQPAGTPPVQPVLRPPDYLARSIILLVILGPLCLFVGGSWLYTGLSLLTGPTGRSEVPAGMRALMEFLKAFVAVAGLIMPIIAVVKAAKVNSEFNAGNYAGADAASKSAATYSKQSILFLVLILIIMATELLRYFGSSRG